MKMEFNDRIWEKLFPFMFPESGFIKAREEVIAISRMTGMKSGNVLDLACGPGRHSIPFAMSGFRVIGVDRSPFLLKKAMRYAARAQAEIEFVLEICAYFLKLNRFILCSAFIVLSDFSENHTIIKSYSRKFMKTYWTAVS